jgi:predicted small metal-binding protein
VDCDYVATGETESELFTNGAQHLKEVHGYSDEKLSDPEFLESARKIIKET